MEFQKKNPIILLIVGKARSGKNTLAQYLKEEYQKKQKKVIISPYTKYLKQYIEEITNKKIEENNKPRDLLQQISSKIIKQQLGMNHFFINRQIEDIKIYSYFMDVIIIPDVRFPEEINRIKEEFPNTIAIGITRKDYISTLTKEQQQDITEIALDNYHDYDFEIENSDLNNLKDKALEVFNQIEKGRNDDE